MITRKRFQVSLAVNPLESRHALSGFGAALPLELSASPAEMVELNPQPLPPSNPGGADYIIIVGG